MQAFFRITLTVLFLFAAFSPGFAANMPEKKAEWTVMVYLCGDNDIEYAALMDFLEMEQSLPKDAEVIVLFDRHKGGSDILGNFTGARLYRIRRAQPFNIRDAADLLPQAQLPTTIASELLEDWGEIDMADPANVVRFIRRAAKQFPANRYALIPWNHGGGWASLIVDEDGGNGHPKKGFMTISQFVEAARQGAQVLPRKRFDLLKYDMCLMGELDVLAQTIPVADYAYASPPVEPCQSSDYLSVLPLFTRNVSTEKLVSDMVDLNITYFNRVQRPAAFAAYNLAYMNEVTKSLRRLTQRLRDLTASSFKELTRATCFATHYEDFMEDIKRGANSFSSVVLEDWLQRIETEVPNAPKEEIKALRDSLNKLIMRAGATHDMQTSKGVTLYIPLRREHLNKIYAQQPFARESGMLEYLNALYTAQDTLGRSLPLVHNIKVGIPVLKDGRNGSAVTDFDIRPVSYISPLSRNVVRFDVTGVGILMTQILNYEQVGEERHLQCVQLVADLSRKISDGRNTGNLYNELSPEYVDGTTPLMRETGIKYKVSNGQALGDITIHNVSASRAIDKNVSQGFGLYRDSTTGGKEIFVKIEFSNVARLPVKVIGYQLDPQGRVLGATGINLRPDGFFRPAVTVLDKNMKERRIFGAPISMQTGLLYVTCDMFDEGSRVGSIIMAETINGQRAFNMSAPLPVRRDPAQVALLNNTYQHAGNNLLGTYVMVQYATSGKDIDALPTFQTITLQQSNANINGTEWIVRDGEKTLGSGPWSFYGSGLPQLSLLTNPKNTALPIGETVQTWYMFLKGQGQSRIWYCIGMGDGTRWAFVPLEQYVPNLLDGVWTSKTERWVFQGNSVELTRDNHTGRGTFTMNGHVMNATGMPFSQYAVYADTENGRLTLISREGVASLLTREGSAKKEVSLSGNWIGNDQSRLSIQPVPNTPYFNLRYTAKDRSEIVCTFAIEGDNLMATLKDGSHLIIPFSLKNTVLTLTFPKMPQLHFTRS